MVPLPKIGPGAEFAPLAVTPGERVFVLTGAGISAESGVRTFRDAGGLWYEHRLEDVATPEGFERDPSLVVLDADLSGSTRTAMFGKRFPERLGGGIKLSR